MIEIFQAYPEGKYKDWISKIAIPFDYSTLPQGTEYDLFKYIYTNHMYSGRFWGLVSWKFKNKSPVEMGEFYEYCVSEFSNGSDCVFINPMIANEAVYANPWEQGVLTGHTGIEQIYDHLVAVGLLSKQAVIGRLNFSFCNYFVANSAFWEQYFCFVDQILLHLENEALAGTVVGRLYQGSASYRKNPEMNMKPFVVERLFTSFVSQHSNFNVSSFPVSEIDYVRKLGLIPGLFCKRLSDIKNLAIQENSNLVLQEWHDKRLAILNNKDDLITLLKMDDPSMTLCDLQ